MILYPTDALQLSHWSCEHLLPAATGTELQQMYSHACATINEHHHLQAMCNL